MTKLVLLHKADSIYEDEPDAVYDFPRILSQGGRRGRRRRDHLLRAGKGRATGYFAVAKISRIIPKPGFEGRFLAMIEPGTFLPFDQEVPRLLHGRPLESALSEADGTPKKGGAVQLAVRRLPDADFARIINFGLPQNLEQIEATRYDGGAAGLHEESQAFERPVLERLTRRAYRDVAFRRKVREAYGYRCALSGLQLRNGGGRPEVQAAHIRPVERRGSDSVRNGLALSGTLHWMFDRGLVSVAEDCETILVSRNKVPGEVVDRLLSSDGKLQRPSDPRDAPHPVNLRWHRENVFGQVLPNEPAPWD